MILTLSLSYYPKEILYDMHLPSIIFVSTKIGIYSETCIFLMEFLHLIFRSQYKISTLEKHTTELSAVHRTLCTAIQATYQALC